MVKKYTKEELLEELHRYKEIYGEYPTREELDKNRDFPSGRVYSDHFGGLNNAKKEAGIPVFPRSRRFTRKELLNELHRFKEVFGYYPRAKDLKKHREFPTVKSYERRFETLNNAKKAAGIPIYQTTSKLDESGALLQEWAEEMKDELSEASIDTYHRNLRDLEIFLEHRDIKLKDMDFRNFKRYIKDLEENDLSKASIKTRFISIKSLFKHLRRKSRLKGEEPIIREILMLECENYMKKRYKRLEEYESTVSPTLSIDEIKVVRKKLNKDIFLLTLFELDLNLGLRAAEFKYVKAKVGEINNAKQALKDDIWLDLRENEGKILLYRQKRNNYHLAALTNDMIKLIKRQLLLRKYCTIEHDKLFFTLRGGEMSEGNVQYYYRRMSEIVGIHLTSHRLRRTMNTRMEIDYHIPFIVRRMRLGHKPKTQTDRYGNMGIDERREHLETIGRL